eukprot:c21895_g2_i2.p2 GENE.c21895_g2_i2~~c21895_g2_i2.p2  ORF type:complete len:211 (+),score=76.64 c21895_g2_i2:1852-2484(+)
MANFGDGNIADWRAKLVEENARVKEALKAAQARRKSQYFRELQETGEKKDEGEEQEQEQQLQQQDIDNSIELAKINEEKERKEEEERKMIIEREEKEIIQNEKHFFEINEINNKNIQKKTNIEMLKEFSRKFLTQIINFEEKYENLIIDAFVWFSYGGGIRLKRKDFNSDNQFSEIVLADFFPLLRFVIFIFTSVLLITFAFHVVLLIAV